MGGCQVAHDLCFTLKETWVILGILIQLGLYLSPFPGLVIYLYFFPRHQWVQGRTTKIVLPRVQGNRTPPLCGSYLIPKPHPLVASATIRGAPESCVMSRPWSLTGEETGTQRGCAADPKQIKDGAEATFTWLLCGFMWGCYPILHLLRKNTRN